MANLTDSPSHLGPKLALCALYMVITCTVAPSTVAAQIYLPHTKMSDAGVRIWVPWMIISTGLRLGLLLHFGEPDGYTWYDACMISWAAALWYWNVEYWVYGNVQNWQYVTSSILDGTALIWMWLARETVAAGGVTFRGLSR